MSLRKVMLTWSKTWSMIKSRLPHWRCRSNATFVSPDDPLSLVCPACRLGPFSYPSFRKAIAKARYEKTTGCSYTTTWSAISQSIDKEGCRWCTIIQRARDSMPPEYFPPQDQDSVGIRVQIETEGNQSISIYLDGYKAAVYTIYAKPDDMAIQEIGNKIAPKKPYVDYEKVLKCIKECHEHEHCSLGEETPLPTRVIDCSNPSKPRLVHTNNQTCGRYCNLSYVWGGDQHQKTTISNIKAYMEEGIDFPLPQTIADAIYVTYKLGIKYLWVDALCIIQDSAEDKERELPLMSNLYRDAYLTISALAAFRADQGFLPDRCGPVVLPYFLADNAEPPSRMYLEYDMTAALGDHVAPVMYSTLDSRGWCLQEAVLSPRRLIFQPPKVFYKCRSFSEMDIGRPIGFNDNPQVQCVCPAKDHILFRSPRDHETDNEAELRERWRKILLDYTGRKITDPSDKFVALASIAELFQNTLRDQYIAGLWQKTLLCDLLWQVSPETRRLPRPTDYRAPTWSWASVDGKLELAGAFPPTSFTSYEAKIISCTATPKISTFPFGELIDATLVLRAKIRPLFLDGGKCSFTQNVGACSPELKWFTPLGICLQPPLSTERADIIKFDCLEGTGAGQDLDFYVVVLSVGRHSEYPGNWIHGLLLLRVEGEAERYTRVGKVDLECDLQWADWLDDTPIRMVTLI